MKRDDKKKAPLILVDFFLLSITLHGNISTYKVKIYDKILSVDCSCIFMILLSKIQSI